jgi:tryptophanyl-tRNA synthetase
MLPGFKEGQEKMSKSDPSSAIFMEDDEVYISHRILFFLAAILLLLLVHVTLNTHE